MRQQVDGLCQGGRLVRGEERRGGRGRTRTYYIAADEVRWYYDPLGATTSPASATGYHDGTSGRARADDAVAPGGRVRQVWQVPARSGPGPNDPSSVLWMYHSHVDESGDTNAGLVGPIILTAKGKARRDGSPRDVDRQFVTLFTVFDENRSPYLDLNIRTFTGDPASVDPDDEDFEESNPMHSINGYVYGNLPGLGMGLGERVRWYPFAMGTEVDLHTPHWHANTLLWNGNRVDLVETLPASMNMLDMEPDNPGTWLYHCQLRSPTQYLSH